MSDAAAVAENATPAKRSKLPLILAAIVVLGGGGAGAWYFLDGRASEEAAAKPTVLAPAIYVSFEPPFVANFESGGLVRFLQVAIQVMTRDPATADQLKQHDPMIRNDLLLLLSNQKYEAISSREGKEQLQQQALDVVRNVIGANAGQPERVESVLFTSFVMQ